MINLFVSGAPQPEAANLAFRVEQDGDTVNVFANDDLLGWFEVDEATGKVRFGTAYISDDARGFIDTVEGQLATY